MVAATGKSSAGGGVHGRAGDGEERRDAAVRAAASAVVSGVGAWGRATRATGR